MKLMKSTTRGGKKALWPWSKELK